MLKEALFKCILFFFHIAFCYHEYVIYITRGEACMKNKKTDVNNKQQKKNNEKEKISRQEKEEREKKKDTHVEDTHGVYESESDYW